MGWVVLGVWIGAVVLAAVLLGYCAYELAWKARRLRDDLGTLSGLHDELATLRVEVEAVRVRAAAAREPVDVRVTG